MSEVTTAKLRIIDLAGSERGSNVNIRGGRGLIEGANINRSLLALGNCINILSDRNKKGAFVPYRDSKLTRLLKDSLGGNTRTVMLSCISPSSLCFEETLNTLNYASRAKSIQTKVARNVKEVDLHVSHYKEIITHLRTENDFLREMMKQNMNNGQGDPAQSAEATAQMMKKRVIREADILKSMTKMEGFDTNAEETRRIYQENVNRINTERGSLNEELESLQLKLQKSKSMEENKSFTKDDYLERISNDLLANFEVFAHQRSLHLS
jgi:kinesin family protein 18/19